MIYCMNTSNWLWLFSDLDEFVYLVGVSLTYSKTSLKEDKKHFEIVSDMCVELGTVKGS